MILCFVAVLAAMAPLPLQAAEDNVPRFDIAHYSVEGNTLLPPEKIAALLKTFTGKKKDFGDVQQALEVLEAAYRNRGYNAVAVVLPEQELDRGTVRLRVVEGKVRNIAVQGNTFHSEKNVLDAFPSLKLGATPLMNGLSKELFVSNENPSKKVTLQMQSGDNEDDLTASLKVADQRPWTVGIMGDNTGISQTGDYRTSFLLQNNNLFHIDHSLTLLYSTSPDHMDKVNIVSGAYRIPIYRLGDSLELDAAYSNVDAGSVAFNSFNLQVSGKGVVAGLKYNHNFRRIGNYQHKLALGFDYKDFDNNLTLQGIDLGNEVVVHPLSLTYSGTLGRKKDELNYYLSVSHNEPWGSKGQRGDFERVSAGANASYSIFRFGANLDHRFPSDWQAKMAFSGQCSGDILVPGEQFGLGGANSVRGFSEREAAGDRGFAGNLEVYTPNLSPRLKLKVANAQARLLGFYDAGTVFPASGAPVGTPDHSFASAGTGVRLGLSSHFSFSFDWGYVLQGNDITHHGDSIVHLKTVFVY